VAPGRVTSETAGPPERPLFMIMIMANLEESWT